MTFDHASQEGTGHVPTPRGSTRWSAVPARPADPGGSAGTDQGVVAVIVALTVTSVLLVTGAFALDFGNVFARQRAAQSAADLAALAAATELPQNPSAALDKAVSTLCDPHNAVDGWPAGTCDSSGWADDGDPGNGEITFYVDGDADGRFTDPVDVISANRPTGVRVITPPARVEFGLGAVTGTTGTSVQRVAMARVGTPVGSGILPVYLLPGETSGRFCVHDPGTTFTDSADPCTSAAAARGLVFEARNGESAYSATTVEENARTGFDHASLPWVLYPVTNPAGGPKASTYCGGQTPSSLYGSSQFFQPNGSSPSGTPTNCLWASGSSAWTATSTLTGAASALESGLLSAQGTTPGRLTRTGCPGTDGQITLDGHPGVDGNALVQPALLSATGTSADPNLLRAVVQGTSAWDPSLAGALSSKVFRCPRLALVPVLSLPVSGTGTPRKFTSSLSCSGYYNTPSQSCAFPVWDLRYVWLDSLQFSSGSPSLQALRGWVLDPRLLPSTVSVPGKVGPYLGDDLPKQVLLVHDIGDPPH